MPRGGARPGAGRPRKSIDEHKRDRTYRKDRHGRRREIRKRDARGGHNRRTLLEHVRACSFRLGRHEHLLLEDDSLFWEDASKVDEKLVRCMWIQLAARASITGQEFAEAAWAFAKEARSPEALIWPQFWLVGELGFVWDDEAKAVRFTFGNADPGAEERAFPRHLALNGRLVRWPGPTEDD
jgi:hypothetical protein